MYIYIYIYIYKPNKLRRTLRTLAVSLMSEGRDLR